MAVASITNQGLWLRKILFEQKLLSNKPTVIYVDNKSNIAITKYLVQRGKTKNTYIISHALGDVEKNDKVKLVHCCSENDKLKNLKEVC